MVKFYYAPKGSIDGAHDRFGESLYDTISRHIRRLAGKFYSILSDEDVQDLIQDTYLRLLENRSNVDFSRNFEGWVYKSCLNQVNGFASRKSRINGWISSYDNDYDEEDWDSDEGSELFTDESYLADKPVISKEFNKRFRMVMGKLNPTDRSIAFMLMEEVPYKEMARELGCSENAVKTKVCRTRAVLKRYGLVG